MNLPLMQAAVPDGVLLEQRGVVENCFAVMIAVVVAPQSLADVVQATSADEISRCCMDGVPRIANVPP